MLRRKLSRFGRVFIFLVDRDLASKREHALREHANLREPPCCRVPGSSGETGRPSDIRLHDQVDGQRRSLISSAHSALRAVQIAPHAAQSRFHNGQLCAWPFTSKNSLPPSDFCGQQTVKRAETVLTQPTRAAFNPAHAVNI
jgi:hypothetical protein